MPYLTPEAKHALGARGYATTCGELNFLLTQVCIDYLNGNGESYQVHNDIRGALENAASEWYRRVTAPYEDKKRRENGDVYYEDGEDPAEPKTPHVIPTALTRKERKALKRASSGN